MRAALLLLVLVAAGLAGCAAPGSPPATTVVIENATYHPGEITVKNGTVLRFENRDDVTHAPQTAAWTVQTPPGTTSQVKVDRVGDFEVPCAYHGIVSPLKLHVVA
ncbi:MAG: Cupredoxin-like domain [Thermoplasmata archaeon]|jgi:plastocyanin|nr:Cupredoxin-like domain [Thermoplasmata archaeon]